MKKKLAILLALVMVIGLCVAGITKNAYAREAQMYLVLPQEIKKEQEIKVKVVLDSDVNLYSVDAYLAYDAQLLEFVPENDIVTGADGILEIKDVFEEETKQREYEITFRTIDVGAAYLNFTEVYLIDYEDLDYIAVPPNEYTMEIGINENVAEDARLSDLLVAPGDLTEAFEPNKLEYKMYVGMDVDTIGISAFTLDEESVVDVEMPETLEEGENVVRVIVTALSGNVNTYTIIVIKGDAQEVMDETTEDMGTADDNQDVTDEVIEDIGIIDENQEEPVEASTEVLVVSEPETEAE